MTQLHQYLSRLYDTILSRQEIEIEIETLEILDRSDKVGQSSEFYVALRFYDGSRLQAVEKLVVEPYVLLKSRYAYHYQKADGTLIFRYDNAPHHPEIALIPTTNILKIPSLPLNHLISVKCCGKLTKLCIRRSSLTHPQFACSFRNANQQCQRHRCKR